MKSYVEALPLRNNANPSEEEQVAYIEQDKAFHAFYMEQMRAFLKKNGVDTSGFESYQAEDWLNYEKSIRLYEALWKYLYENYQQTGKYNNSWFLTPWFLRGDGNENLGMYDPSNLVIITADEQSKWEYSLWYQYDYDKADLIDEYDPIGKNWETAKKNWYEKMRAARYNPDIPIAGVTVPRIFLGEGDTSGILIAVADAPNQEGIKLLVLGFTNPDYNGNNDKYLYHVFSVNLNPDQKTGPGDYYFVDDTRPAPEGYNIGVAANAPSGAYRRFEYDDDKINALINHAITAYPTNNYGNDQGEAIIFDQYLIKGIESFSIITGSRDPVSESPLK